MQIFYMVRYIKAATSFSQTAKEFSIKFKSFNYGTLIWTFS